jgi:hypothetical protein
VWGVTYFALLLLFSIMYTFLHEAFNSTTIFVEGDYSNLLVQSEGAMRAACSSGTSVPTVISVVDNPTSRRNSPNGFDVTIGGGNQTVVTELVPIQMGDKFFMVFFPSHYDDADRIRSLLVGAIDLVGVRDTPVVGCPMSAAIYDELRHLAAALRGDPTAAPRAWLRMLYFSASTQTTLGYGDIVPLTDMARAAVMAQAVLGGVFVPGMFLWALTRRLTPSEDP